MSPRPKPFGLTDKDQVAELRHQVDLMEGEMELVIAERDTAAAENRRLRAGLKRIADSNSGQWGWIAHETLHPERSNPDVG